MIKNIIFDWSGTISDDFHSVYEAAMRAFDALSVKRITFDEFKKNFELPPAKYLKKYIPDELLEKENELFGKFIHDVETPTIFPSAKDTLKKLNDTGIDLFVISSHPHKKLLVEAENYEVTNFFKEIRGDIHDKFSGVKEIINSQKLNLSETAYVGDVDYDIEVGKKVGIKTVAVTYGYHTKERLEKMNPDYMISEFSELLKVI